MPVLAEIGSDLSYDLLVRIEPSAEGPRLMLECIDPSLRERGERLFQELHGELLASLGESALVARIVLFQRLPDPFVWRARLEAAVAMVEEAQKVDYLLRTHASPSTSPSFSSASS